MRLVFGRLEVVVAEAPPSSPVLYGQGTDAPGVRTQILAAGCKSCQAVFCAKIEFPFSSLQAAYVIATTQKGLVFRLRHRLCWQAQLGL